jgi:hypothetical protein
MAAHRSKGNTSSSSKIIQNGDYTVSILEEYPCDTKEQLLERESFYINLTPNCVNSQCPVIDKDKFSHKNYGQAYLKEYGKLTMVCECGEEIKKRNRCIHIKSAKHFEQMKALDQEQANKSEESKGEESKGEESKGEESKSEIMSKMLNLLQKMHTCSLENIDEITCMLAQIHEITFILEKMRENAGPSR